MKKKLYLLALSTLLIGCTNKNSSTPVLDSSIESSSYRSYAETTEDITFCPKEFADFNLTYEINDSIVNEYNATQGRYDGVHVNIVKDIKGGTSIDKIASKEISPIDLVYVDNIPINANYLENLEPYINDESKYTVDNDGNRYLDISDFNSNIIDRLRFNTETLTAGKGENLYGIPFDVNIPVIYYNVDALKAVGVNFISIAENELDNYNKEHNTNYAPRGYCEYLNDPTGNQMTSSKNLDGKTVYKVFNNRIPMSILEMVTLSKQLTQDYNPDSITKYGFSINYYGHFSYVASVGGNTIHFDEDMNQYKFTLGDKQKNYLVTGTDTVEVNGTTYHEGEILSYKDRKFINNGGKSSNDSKLVKLPSSYEQFREYNSLNWEKEIKIDNEYDSLGISPSIIHFSHPYAIFWSQYVCLFTTSLDEMVGLTNQLDFAWDIAPVYTYREFEGEDPKGASTLKIVGEDGFTGKLREVNGTKVKGKYTQNIGPRAYSIPNNSIHKDAAWKFLQYLTSKENQKKFWTNDRCFPTREAQAYSDEYINHKDINYYAASLSSSCSEIISPDFLEDQTWYHNRVMCNVSNYLTDNNLDLTGFFNDYQSVADECLSKCKNKVHGLE